MKPYFKGLAAGVAGTLVLIGSLGYAQSVSQQIQVQFLPLRYKFDGVEKAPPAGQQGFTYNDRTYVPLRFVAEAMGKDVQWDGTNYMITIGGKAETGAPNPAPAPTPTPTPTPAPTPTVNASTPLTLVATKENLPATLNLGDDMFIRVERYSSDNDSIAQVSVQMTVVNNNKEGKGLVLPWPFWVQAGTTGRLSMGGEMFYTHTGKSVIDRTVKAGDAQEVTLQGLFNTLNALDMLVFHLDKVLIKSETGTTSKDVVLNLTPYKSTLTTKDDIVKFLYKNFSKLETSMGPTEFKFNVIENTLLNDAEDFRIDVWYNPQFFEQRLYSGAISDETRTKVKQELKGFQERVGRTLVEAMPSKKFEGGYYFFYYKYPALEMDPVVTQYHKWQNFDEPIYPTTGYVNSYKLTKPSAFRWSTKTMFDKEL